MKVVSSWSGGKESCLAVYKAMEDGLEISNMINMAVDGRCHGLNRELVLAQSRSMGIPLLQKVVSWGSYEEEFRRAVLELDYVEGMVFGDIDIQGHRDWVENTCRELGIRAFLPLWKRERKELMEEFISHGFEAIVVCAKEDFGKNWLGRVVDNEFIRDVENAGADVCGENGEYHTLVVDGPVFDKKIEVTRSRKVKHKGNYFYDILGYRLK